MHDEQNRCRNRDEMIARQRQRNQKNETRNDAAPDVTGKMKYKRTRAREGVIEHVGKQMKRRVVGKVRPSENVLEILQTEAANPRIINDVLRIIETKKINAKNADIQEGASDRQRHEGASVRLPRSG